MVSLLRAAELIEGVKVYALEHHRRELAEAEAYTSAEARMTLVAEFAFREDFPDGSTVVSRYARALPLEERVLVETWHDPVRGTFEVLAVDGARMRLLNIFSDLSYDVTAALGPASLAALSPGMFLLGAIVPVNDTHLFTANAPAHPAACRPELIDSAAYIAAKEPDLVFRNPDKLVQARAALARHHQAFVEYFGDELVIIDGGELLTRYSAYVQHQMDQVDAGNLQLMVCRLSVPPEVDRMRSVALHFVAEEGPYCYREYGKLEDLFTHPDLVTRPDYAAVLEHYLYSDWLSPVPLRRLAARDPQRASTVFAGLLKRRGFSWEADGENLLRQYKPSYFDGSRLPRAMPLTGTLAAANLGSRYFRETARRYSAHQALARSRLPGGTLRRAGSWSAGSGVERPG
jgi:hypothetical protein